jgi:condensin complex subunit 2
MVGFGQKQTRTYDDGEDGSDDLGNFSDDDGPAGGDDFGFDLSQLGAAALGGDVVGGELVAAPQRVEKVQLAYARSAKQVDVRALKALMWENITSMADDSHRVSMHDVIKRVMKGNAAGRVEDLSMHLCFICVLHLCNEHGLALSAPTLDQMIISNVPAC